MILVIQIALGILLGWILIVNFELVSKLFFAPFKFIKWLITIPFFVLKTVLEVFLILVKALMPLVPYLLIFIVFCFGVYGVFAYLPNEYGKYIFGTLFLGGLIYSLYIIVKEANENYKSQNGSTIYWMLMGCVGFTIIFALVLIAEYVEKLLLERLN